MQLFSSTRGERHPVRIQRVLIWFVCQEGIFLPGDCQTEKNSDMLQSRKKIVIG
jgi:hypothetical protein